MVLNVVVTRVSTNKYSLYNNNIVKIIRIKMIVTDENSCGFQTIKKTTAGSLKNKDDDIHK